MLDNLSFEVFNTALPQSVRHEFVHLARDDHDWWHRRLDNSVLSVACRDEEGYPVAFCFATLYITAPVKHIHNPVELGGITVLESHRRRGIRAKMVDLRIDNVVRNGFNPISVTTVENTDSNRYFEAKEEWILDQEFVYDGEHRYLWTFHKTPNLNSERLK